MFKNIDRFVIAAAAFGLLSACPGDDSSTGDTTTGMTPTSTGTDSGSTGTPTPMPTPGSTGTPTPATDSSGDPPATDSSGEPPATDSSGEPPTGGNEFNCIAVDEIKECPVGDPVACACFGCNDDATCTAEDDCVCADCAKDGFCSDPTNCVDDGECDPYNEGCGCADCADHPACA